MSASAAGDLHLTGYASMTERAYDVGWYQETIKRGAFTKTLSENPAVPFLVNHEGLPLASTSNGTLKLSEDGIGLRMDATLDPDDPLSATIVSKVRSGLMSEMSFAFQAVKQEWNDDYSARSLFEVNIHKGDVSVVNFGANPATSIATDGVADPAALGTSSRAVSLRRERAERMGRRVVVVESRGLVVVGDIDQRRLTPVRSRPAGGRPGIPDYTARARMQLFLARQATPRRPRRAA